MRPRIARIFFLLLSTGLIGCSTTKKQAPPAPQGAYRFLDNFSSGHITPAEEKTTPTGKPVLIHENFIVGSEQRKVIVTLAYARILFDMSSVDVDSASRLTFGVGVNAVFGDGAEGIITIESDGMKEVVYRRYLDPINRPEERKWFDESVSLSQFTGKKIKIIFEAGPGPEGDANHDWFAWSNPELSPYRSERVSVNLR